MKKPIATILLIFLCFIGFSQTFKYEARSISLIGNQTLNADSTTFSQSIVVDVGIIGEPYGFVAPATTNGNTFVAVLPRKSKDYDQIIQLALDQANEWVHKKYPDQ